MTPTDEATFITLWEAGTEAAEIARRLGIPQGTVGSRASALVRQGKIERRPRGGTYPQQRALARQEGTAPAPARAPARAPAPASPPATHPRVDIKQWTLRLSQPLIDAVKAQAATMGQEPSHIVEELLWTALTDR